MTMTSCLVRFCRRQLHTIVSREIIKPSSSTPSHLKTYNFSLLDHLAPYVYLPMVIFFQNLKSYDSNFSIKTLDMKKSLSQTLVHYYPFAGTLNTKTPSCIDCNDEGVEFLEVHNDQLLSDFLNNMQHEDMDQLFPSELLWKWEGNRSNDLKTDRKSPLSVQFNQFACGGIAVAILLSHKIADGSSLCNFFNDWAIMTRSNQSADQNHVSTTIDPRFASFDHKILNYQGVSLDKSRESAVTQSFMFPRSKIDKLKLMVVTMAAQSEQPITNPTRLEALNWLLYKSALQAATRTNLSTFNPSGFVLVSNLRDKMKDILPKTTIGNYYVLPGFSTENASIVTPTTFIGQLKNMKMEVQRVQNIKEMVETVQHTSLDTIIEEEQRKLDNYYVSTSLCNYPLYGIDFGWGKPKKVAIAGTFSYNSFLLMDAPNGDGIEAFVSLGKEDMEIFKRDTELLSFC